MYLHIQTFCFCSTQTVKKSHCLDPTRTHTWGGGGSSGHLRAHQPAHPFVQDPAMPPLPPPNTLAQLEEACRRLEEVSKPSKQRYELQTLRSCMSVLAKNSLLIPVLTYGFPLHRHSTSSLQRDKSHPVPVQNGSSALQTDEYVSLLIVIAL